MTAPRKAPLAPPRASARVVAVPPPPQPVVPFDQRNIVRAARRAVATFVFATLGQIGTFEFIKVDIAAWKIAASAGAGALLNVVYRWSESVLKEPTPPVDVPGGEPLTK